MAYSFVFAATRLGAKSTKVKSFSMSCILNIETSTDVCSVSVSQDGACIFSQEDHDGPNHAVKLGTFVDEALSFADSHAIPLDAVAVSCGPGSYTGLRIGASMAKGICFGQDLKLIAVPTLELMAVPVLLREEVEEGALLCPMIDARRMEVYSAVYDRALHEVRGIQADVVDAEGVRVRGVAPTCMMVEALRTVRRDARISSASSCWSAS